MVHIGLNPGGPAFAVGEPGLAAQILAVGMQFADEEAAAGRKGSCGFAKDAVHAFDVFQHKIARDQFGGSIAARPAMQQVRL